MEAYNYDACNMVKAEIGKDQCYRCYADVFLAYGVECSTPRLFWLFCRMFHVSLFIVLFANNTMKGRTYYSRAVPRLKSRNIIRNFQIYFKNNLILHLNKIYIYIEQYCSALY